MFEFIMKHFKRDKKKKRKENQRSSSWYANVVNDKTTQRNNAMRELASTTHAPIERFHLIVKTYREGKDLIVVPESWRSLDSNPEGFLAQQQFSGKKAFVDTPHPSIVRTR